MSAHETHPGGLPVTALVVHDPVPARMALVQPGPAGPAPLAVSVFETVTICRADGVLVTIGSMQQKIVLTLLVAYSGRSVPVDRIAEELWGRRRPDTWLSGIRTLANSLRRSAGDRDFVHWTGRGYRLHKDADRVETDVDQMLRCTEQAAAALAAGQFDCAEAAARRALRHYGGGPWTTDCWSWSELAAEAYCALARALLANGRYVRCLVELSQAPEELEWHEGVAACRERARAAVLAPPL